ncbi:hypothetical protein [Streptomyces sp. NPDC059176]|uniref:hypothetical protein n=1 Tax=unclassified Streptomyces TaxID=2593676 RepID=UPI0036AB1D8E
MPVGAGADEAWQGLWERLAADIGSIPEIECERQRRVSARRGHSVDATHPPTHLRRECLLRAAPVDAAVVTARVNGGSPQSWPRPGRSWRSG